MNKDETMTSSELAEKLGISLPTLHRRLKSGELALKPVNPPNPNLKRQKQLLFARSEVEALLQK
jgi:predicted DNA-binding transcriptional regulator AlpA